MTYEAIITSYLSFSTGQASSPAFHLYIFVNLLLAFSKAFSDTSKPSTIFAPCLKYS